MSSGGPATAVWAWFIGSIMAYCIASSGSSPLLLNTTHDAYMTPSGRISICVPDCWRHVLCHETRGATQTRCALGLDHRLV